MPEFKPRELSSITDKQKCKLFDQLYAMAREHFDGVIAGERGIKDCPEMMFELAFEGCLGPKVWDKYNASL